MAGIVPSPVLAVIPDKIVAASSPSAASSSEAGGPAPENTPAPASTETSSAPTGGAGEATS